jgi:hypothetical protein
MLVRAYTRLGGALVMLLVATGASAQSPREGSGTS